MMRKLKTTGSALAAALVLSAMAAPSAMAELFAFGSAAEHTTLTGEQIGTTAMTVDAGALKCEIVELQGTMTAEAAVEQALTPTFKNCTFAGFLNAEVLTHSCAFVLGVLTREGSSYEAEARVECAEANDSIQVVQKALGVTKCTVDIPEQEELGQVTLSEEGSPTKIRADISLTGIEYDQTAGSGFLACATAENTTNGTYEGSIAIKGSVGEAGVNLSLDQLPQKVKILKNPIKLKGKGSKETFEVENTVNEQLLLPIWIYPPGIVLKGTCTKLVKMNDKCTEEIECNQLTGMKKFDFAVVSVPPGGDMVKVEGC